MCRFAGRGRGAATFKLYHTQPSPAAATCRNLMVALPKMCELHQSHVFALLDKCGRG